MLLLTNDKKRSISLKPKHPLHLGRVRPVVPPGHVVHAHERSEGREERVHQKEELVGPARRQSTALAAESREPVDAVEDGGQREEELELHEEVDPAVSRGRARGGGELHDGVVGLVDVALPGGLEDVQRGAWG